MFNFISYSFFWCHQTVASEAIQMQAELSKSPFVNIFFNAKQYHIWNNNFGDDVLMKKTDLDAVEASNIIYKYGPMFVES